MTITKHSTVTPEVIRQTRTALFYLTNLWDTLREIEQAIEQEIETSDISDLAFAIDDPQEAYSKIAEEDIREALKRVLNCAETEEQ